MRRWPLLILVALIFTIPAAALETIHSGWHYPGDEFRVGETNYSIIDANDPYQLYLKVDGRDYVLGYGRCTRSRGGFDEYCFMRSDYGDCEKENYTCPEDEDETDAFWCCPYDVTNIKFQGGKAFWGAYLEFKTLGEPSVSLSRTLDADDKDLLDVNDKLNFTLTLKNTGEEAMTGGRFVERLPPGFSFLPENSDPAFRWEDGDLILKVNLDPGDEQEFKYVVRVLRYTNGTFNGTLSYLQRGEERALFPSPITVTAPEPYQLVQELIDDVFLLDEKGRYHLSLNNTAGRAMNISLRMEGFGDLTKVPGGKRKGPLITLEEELEEGENFTIDVELENVEPGWYRLYTELKMNTGVKQYFATWQDQVIIRQRTITPLIMVTPSHIVAGDPFTLRVRLDNTDSNTNYQVYGATLDDGMETLHYKGGNLPAGMVLNLFEEERTAPAGNITFTLQAEYQEQGREQQSLRASETITILEQGEPPDLEPVTTQNATRGVNASAVEPRIVDEEVQVVEEPIADPATEAPEEVLADPTEEPRGFVKWWNGVTAWFKGLFS